MGEPPRALLVAIASGAARGAVAAGPRRGCRIVRVRGPTATWTGSS